MKAISTLAICILTLFMACIEKSPAGWSDNHQNSGPFDNAYLSGTYSLTVYDITTSINLEIFIGTDGNIDKIVSDKKDTLDCDGNVSEDGELSVTGIKSSNVDTNTYTFIGTIAVEDTLLSASGTYTGQFKAYGITTDISGTWEAFGANPDTGTEDTDSEDITPDNSQETGDYLAVGDLDTTDYGFDLIRINGTNGEITRIGGTNFYTDICYGKDGNLYGISDGVHIIDPESGSSLFVSQFSYDIFDDILMTDAAVSLAGDLFVLSNGTQILFKADISTGKLSLAGKIDTSIYVNSIAFSPFGKLFGGGHSLYQISPADGSVIDNIMDLNMFITALMPGKVDGSESVRMMDDYPTRAIYSVNVKTLKVTTEFLLNNDEIRSIIPERSSVLLKRAFLKAAMKYPPARLKTEAEVREIKQKLASSSKS